MVDITGHLNYLNLKLQGKQHVVTLLYDAINAFKTKLRLWEGQLTSVNLTHFSTYHNYQKSQSNSDFNRCISNIKDLLSDLQNRFEDFTSCEDDLSLFTAPFSFEVQKANSNIQMGLIETQCNSVLKNKYNEVRIPQFYYYLPGHYSEMRQLAVRILAMLGSTYLCEQLFSLTKANKSAQKSRLRAEHLSSILKVAASQNPRGGAVG
jgi:hypothetical protein